MPTKPSDHIDWTDGSPAKVQEPTSGKKLLGWALAERPAFQYMNWLFYQLDQWDQYFEAVTDQNSANIVTLQGQTAALGQASNVSASNSGHTFLTGTNVQAQLDETDQSIKDLHDAVTSGKGIDLVGYDPSSPTNWSPAPSNAGAGLDQLASRMKAVEAATSGANYDDQTFFDYFVPADGVNGAGNTGLTDNLMVNPRQIKLADGRLLYGEDRLYIRDIQPTGNYDANGLMEWAPTSPTHDVRVRFYGTWFYVTGAVANYCVQSYRPGDYVLITGVYDTVAMMGVETATSSNNIEVWVDGVDTGTQISMRGQAVAYTDAQVKSRMFFNNQMAGLSQNIHTVKLVNGSTDTNSQIYLSGFNFVNTNPIELASTFYLQKVETDYAQQTPTLATATGNGGRSARYIDRADGLRKEIVSNSFFFQSSVSGTIGSGATNFTVNSAAGFSNNCLLLIQDSPSNSELVLANSVNTVSGAISIAGSGTRNSYTNPTVTFHGKVMAATNHTTNEKKDRRRHWLSFGAASNGSVGPVNIMGQSYASTLDSQAEDGGTRIGINSSYSRLTPWVTSNPNFASMNFNSYNYQLIYEGCFTGLDIFLDCGDAGSGLCGKIQVYVDGVLVSNTYNIASNQQFWLPICSDLPYGHHIVQIVDDSNSLGGFQYGFVFFQEYSPADTSTALALPKGDLINSRNIASQYVWNNNPSDALNLASGVIFGISKGVVRHGALKDTYVTGTGWSAGPSFLGYTCGYVLNSDTTGDRIQKSFFGTGLDICFQVSTNYGICQIDIDGVPATSANFPTAVFNGFQFSPGTGKIDQYSATVLQANVSMANLSTTPKWHTVTMTVTGTKNTSSADYYATISSWDIHGAVQTVDASCGYRPMHSAIVGGVKDLRAQSYNGVDLLGQVQGFTTSGYTGNYGITSGDALVTDGNSGDIYMTEDGMVDISYQQDMYQTGANGDHFVRILVDGIYSPVGIDDALTQQNQNVTTQGTFRRYFLKKGWHSIVGQAEFDGSGSCYAYSWNHRLTAYVVAQPKFR
jgi:hypothetical protein